MSFESAYHGHTKGVEKGYANSSADSGGETFRGISRVHHPRWAGWQLVDRAKAELGLSANATLDRISRWRPIDTLTARDPELDGLVAKFFYDEFYKRYEAPEIPERLADKLFDTAVNVGHGRAAAFLQSALNCLLPADSKLAVDGALGPKTRAAIGRAPLDKILSRFCAYQRAHYERWLQNKGAAFWSARESFLERAAWLPPAGGEG
jgi:lysozyme family protein